MLDNVDVNPRRVESPIPSGLSNHGQTDRYVAKPSKMVDDKMFVRGPSTQPVSRCFLDESFIFANNSINFLSR